MDPFVARSMVEMLSKGVHPVTGQALSHSDSCSVEEVRAALAEVLEHCTIDAAQQYALETGQDKQHARKARAAQNAQRYPRGGEHWSAEEERQMLAMLRRGKNVYQIAGALKRTPRAVSERMRNLQWISAGQKSEADKAD